jgi:phosphatidylcholine synthase
VLTGKLLAASIHIFTASGIIAGFAAMLAVTEARWEAAFAWLGVAAVIDGLDGPLARHFRVKAWLPRFSGERLDLVIDYFTYVIVPALMVYVSDRMPQGWALVAAAIILVTSLFHFCDMDSKTEDGFFVGFPAIWNVIAFYLFIFPMPPSMAFASVAILGVLTFIPLKWVHPLRVERFRGLTVAVLAIWAGAALLVLWRGFPVPIFTQVIIALCSLWLLLPGLVRSIGSR